MRIDPSSRLVIIGNCGSGKTTLARRLAATVGLPHHSLDPIHWEPTGVRRETGDATRMVLEVAGGAGWTVEGVFGRLAGAALPRATALVWLDLPWDLCREGLLRRGAAQEGSAAAFEDLMAWAGDYWTRQSPSSFGGHADLFARFTGEKFRLRSHEETAAWLSD